MQGLCDISNALILQVWCMKQGLSYKICHVTSAHHLVLAPLSLSTSSARSFWLVHRRHICADLLLLSQATQRRRRPRKVGLSSNSVGSVASIRWRSNAQIPSIALRSGEYLGKSVTSKHPTSRFFLKLSCAQRHLSWSCTRWHGLLSPKDSCLHAWNFVSTKCC